MTPDEPIHSNSDGNLTREKPGWPHLNPAGKLPSLKVGGAQGVSLQSTTYEELLSKVLNLDWIKLLELISTLSTGTKEIKEQINCHHKARK